MPHRDPDVLAGALVEAMERTETDQGEQSSAKDGKDLELGGVFHVDLDHAH